MKPRSIISLIIAAVFVLGGIIICVIADNMAKAEGVMLFPAEDDGGNLVYEMDLAGIKKLNITTVDADISVYGGAERSYIRILNFNANYYKMSLSGGSLIFNQVDDFLSMFKFWDNGFSFKGMRYILRFGDDTAGEKRIEIYLSDEDAVNGVTLSTDTGALEVKNCDFYAGYTLRLGGGSADISNLTGCTSLSVTSLNEVTDLNTVNISDVSASSLTLKSASLDASLSGINADKINMELNEGDVSMDSVTADEFVSSSGNGNTHISSYKFTEGKFTADGGDVSIGFVSDKFTAIVSTVNGKISENDTYVESFTQNVANAPYRAEITTRSGDVTITYPSAPTSEG